MTKIKKSSFDFLKEIKQNNTREWFTENKPRYVEAQQNAKDLSKDIASYLEKHDHIEGAKVFRIYRDVRFSKDKTPYKTNLGISFNRATDYLRGGMYINIEPGNTFVGGGFWGPNAADLKRIRTELALNASEFRAILNTKAFKKNFGSLSGETLKTSPRGFAKDHPDVDLLRHKQFLISRNFTDKEALSESFAQEASNTFKAMRPFFDFMSEVLTTNENGESIV